MSIPVRNISKYGVITDGDPYDIPTEAWSFAKNVRFRNGKIVRSPVFRKANTLAVSDPRFLASHKPTSGLDFLFVGYLDGRVFRFTPTSETDWSIAAYATSAAEAQWTSTHLADVLYVNREDRVPWYLRASDSTFQALASGWNSGWRTRLLRACGGALVALNVTKAGTNNPTMVKTSSFALAGTVPASWDHTDPATNASENILAEMEGQIIDACPLGTSLMIYGAYETWVMEPQGAGFLFNYEKLRFNKGAIGANCSREINGKNYVFGPDDIWVHDGVSSQSICDTRTRDFIFGNMSSAKASRFFVEHNPQLNNIHFCYVSGDSQTAFSGAEGCNRAAIYDYTNDTWSFDDLPLVFGAARANLDTAVTWATVSGTWTTTGGSWLDLDSGIKRTYCYVGDTNAGYGLTKALYAFDPYSDGSTVVFPVDTSATKGAYLERDGIDLDEVGADLQGYKLLSSIIPQGRLGPAASPIQFAFGSADYFNASPTFTAYQTWDGGSLYKLDYNTAGRYLSMRVLFDDYKFMSLSGFDLDLDVLGER